MSIENTKKALDKYEASCSRRSDCRDCPYDGENSRWGCFSACLRDWGVSQDTIDLFEPVVRKVSDEGTPMCQDCGVLLVEICICCKCRDILKDIEEIHIPKCGGCDNSKKEVSKGRCDTCRECIQSSPKGDISIKLSDLSKEWDKFFMNTPYHNSLHYLVDKLEQGGNL